ncbi:MAG: twin-arginine translocase TatA/TatE family subunit [Bacteroidota bacterium]
MIILGFIPGGIELAVILMIVLLLFGGRKLPDLMKGLGQGIKEFKLAKKSLNDNEA